MKSVGKFLNVFKVTTKILPLLLVCLVIGQDAFAQRGKKKVENEEIRLRMAENHFLEGEKYYILGDLAKAYGAYQKSLELNSENATVLYKMAEIALENEDFPKATTYIGKALALEKNNPFFYQMGAEIYTRQGDFTKAAALYETMIETISGQERYLFDLAALYIFQNQPDKAISTYDRAEDAFGVNEQITFQKQKLLLDQGNVAQAIKEGEKLIENYPDEPVYTVALAEIILLYDDQKNAIPILEAVLEHHEDHSQARLMLSEIYRGLDQMQKAAYHMQAIMNDPSLDTDTKTQILAGIRMDLPDEKLNETAQSMGKILTEIHPEESDVHAVYADILYVTGEREKALHHYHKTLSLGNTSFTVWQNVIQIEAELERMMDVITHSDQALELYPNQAVLYYYNGAGHMTQKDYKKAVYALEQGKKYASSDLRLVSIFNGMLGDAYNGTKEYKKSDQAYEAALEFDPDNYTILNNYSYYLALRGERLTEAEKMSSKVARDNPDNPTFLDTHAWVLYKNGKYKEARKVMEQALKGDEKEISAVHFDHYGDILYRLGKMDDALMQWKKAFEMDASLENLDKKIAERKLYE